MEAPIYCHICGGRLRSAIYGWYCPNKKNVPRDSQKTEEPTKEPDK